MAWIFVGFGLATWIVEAVWLKFRAEVGGHVGLILFVVGIVCTGAALYFGRLATIQQGENRERVNAALERAVEAAKTACRAEYAPDWMDPNPMGRLLNPYAAVCTLSKDIVRVNILVANAYHLARDLRLVEGWVIFKDMSAGGDGMEIAKVQVMPWADTVPAQTANHVKVSEPATLETAQAVREVHARGALRVLFRSKFSTVAGPGKPDHRRDTTDRVRIDIES